MGRYRASLEIHTRLDPDEIEDIIRAALGEHTLQLLLSVYRVRD